MSIRPSKPRVCLVGNPQKPEVVAAFDATRAWLAQQPIRLASELGGDIAARLKSAFDRIVVLGGDGTILRVARLLGTRQTPIVGVNMGKLGYLADFSTADLQQHFRRIVTDAALISARMMLEIEVVSADGAVQRGFAFNDCVIHAGAPFRMVEMVLRLDGQGVSRVVGDGLILSTPTGSTAHNMSCGGPIVEAGLDAVIVTPICPHSLTHRPVVVGTELGLEVDVVRCNEGTSAVVDGQESFALQAGGQVRVRRAAQTFKLVRHPERKAWRTLVEKLGWGRELGR